jgi:hypothetical protein
MTANEALTTIVRNTASLSEGTIPGGTWWAAAINFLAKIGSVDYDLDWTKLGTTIHDAFTGAVKLLFSSPDFHAAIYDAIFTGIWDAVSMIVDQARSRPPDGGVRDLEGINAKLMAVGIGERNSFQVGTRFVDRTGLALIHRGEQVVPANSAAPARGGFGGGGGGLVVNVNAPLGIGPGTAEQLVRELNSILGARGLNLAVS